MRKDLTGRASNGTLVLILKKEEAEKYTKAQKAVMHFSAYSFGRVDQS
jgi:hypothetical protein